MLLAATEYVALGGGGRSGGGGEPLLLLIALFLLGFFLIKRQRHRTGGIGHGASPMSHLQQRFASGEINQAEFEHRRAVLRGDKNIPSAPSAMAPPSSTTEPAAPEPPASDDLDE